MNLFYAVLAYVMAVYNLSKGLNGPAVTNLVMGGLWLIIGIVFTVKHVKEIKKAKNRRKEREREV